MTYYAIMVQVCPDNKVRPILGTYHRRKIDGRLNLENALATAREIFREEADFMNIEYLGFQLAKGSSWYCLDDAKTFK